MTVAKDRERLCQRAVGFKPMPTLKTCVPEAAALLLDQPGHSVHTLLSDPCDAVIK